MNSLTAMTLLNTYEPRSYHTQLPIVWRKAYDYRVWDTDGKEYIDFTSGIFTANCGHANTEIMEAVRAESYHLVHSYSFATEIRARLVEKLCKMTGYEKVFLCSTGSEAVEAALRCMGGVDNVYAFREAFHGNTYGAKTITQGHTPFYRAEGVMVESYVGWSAEFHNKKWLQELCRNAGVFSHIWCFDEVQAGFGRTGKLFGYEHYNVKPDLVVIGKALGNGMPISGVLGSAELLDKPDDLSSTHSGNPLCCAAALATLEYIEKNNLVQRAANMESVFLEELKEYKLNGHGMVWAILFEDEKTPERIVERCAEKGLLLLKTHRKSIKIGPPLTTPESVIRQGLGMLKEVIHEIAPHRHCLPEYS